jgi:two-component system phosphate regulon sensor histidine kinase PhoR
MNAVIERPSRHLVWLTVAVLAPCAALVILAVRLMDQERQLSARRAQEARERAADVARSKLLAELEGYRSDQKPAAFRGLLRSGRIVLPWDQPHEHAAERARLENAVRSRMAAEFERLAALAPAVTDDLGIPIALYAIPHVAPERRRRGLETVTATIRSDPYPYSPAAFRLLQSLARENQMQARASALEAPCANAEAAERFQAAYAQAGGADPARWLSWGDPLFLIGFTPAVDGAFSFRAVAARQLAVRVSQTSGQPLGDPFPGLKVELGPVPSPPDALSRPALIAVIGAALFLAALGGLLVWRDFHRERQLATLRAQFIASVSHELRTPLTAIRLFIESLRMNPGLDVPTRNEYLDTMNRESERLSRLVNNVLEFSRMERQTKTYAMRPLSLAGTVASVVAAFRPVMEHAGYRLETSVEKDLPDLSADGDAIEQAVGNLLANAMKYSGPSREIRLQLRRVGRHAQIEVRDFGIGIPAADQARIFDPYYRVASKENTSIQGAGLGLTVVRHIVRGHGGDVEVESAPGKGSAFRLLLPL